MLGWLSDNSNWLNVCVNTAMLIVWIVYLQLLLSGYRHQRRASILITRGAGHGIRARCLITNMSLEPIYVTSLVATLVTEEERLDVALTDLRDLPEDLGTDPRSAMRQGSLATGHYLDLGHFDEVLAQLVEATDDFDDVEAVKALELTAVALYASDRHPVGARRCFAIERGNGRGPRITPTDITTKQLRSRRERRKLLATLSKHL